MSRLIVFYILATIFGSHAAKLPETFQRCDYKQDLNKCLPKAMENAISQLSKPFKSIGIPSLEPIEIPSLVIAAGSGPVNVDQNFKDVKISGLSKFKIAKADLDQEKKTVIVEGLFAEAKLNAKYELNGRVMFLPVQGEGPSTIILTNVKINVVLNYEEIDKNGEKHLKFLTCKTNLDPERISYNFENLFNGDKRLGDNINKVLNENDKEVFADVRSGYEEVFNRIILSYINEAFSRLPVQEVFKNFG